MGLEAFLQRVIQEGALELTLPNGARFTVGDGSPPRVAVALKSALWGARIAARAEMALGEAYMEGAVVFERGDIYDLLDLAGRNLRHRPDTKRPGPLARWSHDLLQTRNARRQARRNVHHHYDLSNDFYRRFLDPDLQYSCAYFEHPGQSLEEAQRAKQRHIAAKLVIDPDQRVLDIGCGWGGLALRLAAETGARVDGVTLSTAQLEFARQKAEATGLAARVNYHLTDYRDVAG
ncbi:MAG: SAM-dependent methyltransferase, partial [Caulobacteraceae bacterium]